MLGAIKGRTPTQMMAGVASDKAYTAGKDFNRRCMFNHKKTLEDKIGGFNKHCDKQLTKHKTRYAEEINVQNKTEIDDVKGLDAAYSNVNGITIIGNTLYIGGTGKTGLDHKVNDVIADLFFIPTHKVQLSERYKDAMEESKNNPDVDRLVGHSLGSSVVQEISFNNWTGQGRTEINPTTDMSNGFNPNDNSG